jgi:Domain of unknown function (DUF1707)/Cell wall-active antibiotics response 4TMS YvqF
VRGEVDDQSRRVSDVDRERAVAALRNDLLAGLLTLEEFSERAGAAYASTVGADLAQLREDLPEPVSTTDDRRPTTWLTAGLFGHLVRRGRLRLRRHTVTVSAFADVDYDLRAAQIDSSRVVVHILGLFGNVDLYVPEGIDVEVGGTILFGRRRDWGRDNAFPDAPRLRVRANGFFCTVDVWRIPHGLRGSYGDLISKMKARQHELSA